MSHCLLCSGDCWEGKKNKSRRRVKNTTCYQDSIKCDTRFLFLLSKIEINLVSTDHPTDVNLTFLELNKKNNLKFKRCSIQSCNRLFQEDALNNINEPALCSIDFL